MKDEIEGVKFESHRGFESLAGRHRQRYDGITIVRFRNPERIGSGAHVLGFERGRIGHTTKSFYPHQGAVGDAVNNDVTLAVDFF